MPDYPVTRSVNQCNAPPIQCWDYWGRIYNLTSTELLFRIENTMSKTVYTIGYTGFDITSFTKKLKELGITCLIDVRSIPIASEFYKVYSRQTLEPILKENGILYVNFAKEFGARQPDKRFYEKYGYLDFEEFIISDEFISGVARIKKGASLNHRFALMCAEKDPLTCHRAIMVSRGLQQHDLNVEHVHPDGKLEKHVELEKRLVDLYFGPSDQVLLFDDLSYPEKLLNAYAKQNAAIGYKKQD